MDATLVVGVSLVTLAVAVIGLLCGVMHFFLSQSRRICDLEDGFKGMQRDEGSSAG